MYRCNIVISRFTTLAMPAFPSKYSGPVDCVYYFFVPWGRRRVKLTFLYLDMVAADCSTDKLEIYDGFSSNTISTRICNGNKITEFVSTKNVKMRYIGSSAGKYRGFHVSVTFL